MRLKTISYLGLLLVLLCSGCGLKEGVVQLDTQSFLWFTGNIPNATVYIDDLAPFALDNQSNNTNDQDENNVKRSNKVHYEISPGKHTIVIKKAGEDVVNRTILLGSGMTKEIKIP